MKDFDYIIIGGGCAGLSLAHELNLYNKFENRTLAIIEPREEYKRDKTWSFWKVIDHNFDDCVKKSWDNFTINSKYETQHLQCNDFPYQSIDSGLFYSKIINELKKNKNISFFKDIKEININNSFIFNSVPTINKNIENLWQHFCGVEIQTKNDIFDNKIINLMDFNCDQRNSVHFFYTLPFEKNKALIETTWLSNMTDDSIMDYDEQIKEYIEKKTNEYRDRFANPFIAGSRGFIDDVIIPSTTRKRICRSLEMLRNKKLSNPWKKHDNIPL